MPRPELTRRLSAQDFLDFYWLKKELLTFCRAQGLSTAGSKDELKKRIAQFLATGERLKPERKASKRAAMPDVFTRDTVIGSGWRSSQALRAFFEREIGPRFHFNGVMRDFIKGGEGKTLQDAIDAWEADKRSPAKKDIDAQFEYNRHMRAYFEAHPGATRAEALAAWQEKRSGRRSEIKGDKDGV